MHAAGSTIVLVNAHLVMLPTERNVKRHERDDNTKMQNSKPHIFLVSILALLIAGLGGGVMVIRQRQVRVGAEEGIRREIRENYEGVQEVRAAIPTEIENIPARSRFSNRRKPDTGWTARRQRLA
jgi:hypothetical protein